MSNIGKLAPFLDGIRFVPNSATRDQLFPTPDTDQRVQNVETGYVERYSGTAWVPDWPIVSSGAVVNVLATGAKGDGATDDTSAFQKARDALITNGGGILQVPYTSSGYIISQLLIQNSNIWVQADPSVVIKRTAAGVASAGMVEFDGAQAGTSTTLSSTTAIGAVALSVVSSSGFAAGDYIEIESSVQLGSAPYLYEINRVDSTGAGVLNLKWAIRNTYTVGTPTVTIRKLTVLTNVGVSGGVWTGPGDVGDCIRFKWCISPIASQSRVTNHGQQGVVLQRVRGGYVGNCESYAGVTTGSHGVALYSTEGAVVDHCIVRDGAWDAFDVGNGSMYNVLRACAALDMGDVGYVIGHGQHGHHNVVRDSVANRCAASGYQFGDPSYESDEDNAILDSFAFACAYGVKFRTASTRNKCRNVTALASTNNGFDADTVSLDNELVECVGRSSTTHGASINGRTRVVGGHYDSNTGNGIRVTGSAAADTVLDGVNAKGNTLDNIAVLSSAARTVIRNPVVESAATGKSGILVQGATDVVITAPIARNNANWGVLISNSGSDTVRSRIADVSQAVFTGNGTGTYNNNNQFDLSADKGDADFTLTVGSDAPEIRVATPLTTNRTATLSTTGAYPTALFRVVREAASTGASTLSVGGLKSLAAGQWCVVQYDNTGVWRLRAFGSL